MTFRATCRLDGGFQRFCPMGSPMEETHTVNSQNQIGPKCDRGRGGTNARGHFTSAWQDGEEREGRSTVATALMRTPFGGPFGE